MFHNQNCECMFLFCAFKKKQKQLKMQDKRTAKKDPIAKTPNQPNRKKPQAQKTTTNHSILLKLPSLTMYLQ